MKKSKKKIGRPTDSWKHKFLRVIENSGSMQRIQNILSQTKNDDTFLKALEICLNRGLGKPLQQIEQTGDNQILLVRSVQVDKD